MRRKIFNEIAVVLFFLMGTAYAGGLPTFDAASVAQLQQTVKQLQEQYQQLKKQYEAITGSYERGQIGLTEAMQASSIVPGSWQEVVELQKKGAFGAKQDYYEKLIQTLPQELFENPKSQHAATYKMSTDSVRAAMAGGDVLYSQVQTHLNNLSVMSQKVDTTTNIKDAQDLQNRIATETGMLQSTVAKFNAINTNLLANMLNQQNQGDAITNARYRGKQK